MNEIVDSQQAGQLKSMYDLAKKTNSNVLPANSLFNNSMPTDVSMNLNKLINEEDE